MMRLAFRLAARELRAGTRGLRLVIACLALGVAAIAAVGTLRAGIEARLAADGRQLLGGDLEVMGGSQPLPDLLRQFLRARGNRLTDVVTMRSMLFAMSGARMLVELKAVDQAWPLVGAAVTDPPGAARDGVLVDRLVLQRLHVGIGDTVRIGNATLPVRGVLVSEPDRVAEPSLFGPRVLMPLSALPATGLIQPGSFVDYRLRAVLPPNANDGVQQTIAAVAHAFPQSSWRMRDARNAAPGVTQFIDQTSLFMSLVGLTALLVGGIGVAGAVRAWLQARTPTIATLRCLGAPPGLVLRVYGLEVGAVALIGICLGLAAGAGLPALAVTLAGGALPIVPAIGLFPRPLALAGLSGALTAGAFALPVLERAGRIPGAALFRDPLIPQGGRPSARGIAATVTLAALLATLVIATAPDRRFAAGFCLAAALTLALFRAGGFGLMRLVLHLPRPPSPAMRIGLANLHRPGAATPTLLVSVGLGLSTLAAVALIEGNMRRQIAEQMPQDAPRFFFIDIQQDQLARFRSIATGTPGVTQVEAVPSLRARLVSVKGIPADQVRATRDTAWALRGDRGLTYSASMPEGTRLVAGQWWPADYTGPPLVSFDATLARGWSVHVGDTMRVNVLGRDIDLRVANLRDIAWRSFGLNFTMVASPGLLSRAPHTNIATVRAAPSADAALLQRVTDAMANVSGIRVADVLAAIGRILGQIGGALTATGSVTLLAGALVLAGAVAAGQRRRIAEAVILKTLGASRAQIRTAWLMEFGVLGLTSGLLAVLVGTAASFAVMRFVMHAPWTLLPGRVLVTVGGCVAVMLAFGYAGTEQALRTKAAPLLRND